MANSDNVIRAGLTTKNIDVRTLLETLDFSEASNELSSGRECSSGERVYETPAKEFQVSFFTNGAAADLSVRRAVAGVMLVIDGEYEFDDGTGRVAVGGRGTSWFRPAMLKKGIVRPKDEHARLVLAEVGK